MKRVIITPPSGASRLERIARWRPTHWLIFTLANLLILFACSKASDDDNPNPEPQPQPQPELKGNYVQYDGKAKPVLTAEYRNTGNDNLRLYFYVSQDRKERVVCNLNAALHSDALIDLSKKEKKHDGQAYWGITYYNADSEQLLNAWGYPDDGFTLFDSGTLDIKGSLTLSPTLTLTKGSLKGTDGKDHTFAMHYQGPLTKVEDTKPDPTDTQAPHAGRLSSVQVVSQDKAIVRWNPASDNKTPEEKLRYVVCWKEKEGDKTYNSGEPKENILSYEITAKFEKNRIYIAWVEVYDQAGNKSKSNTEEFSYYYDMESPQVGTIEITDITMNSAMVKWTPATDNKTPQDKLSYTIFWSKKDSGNINKRNIPQGSELSFKVNFTENPKLALLEPKTTYRVWVTVRDESGNEGTYLEKEFTTDRDKEAPVVPYVFIATDPDAIEVHWRGRDNITPDSKLIYKVYIKNELTGEVHKFDSDSHNYDLQIFKWKNPEPFVLYKAWVKAYDEEGNEGISKSYSRFYHGNDIYEKYYHLVIDGQAKKVYDVKVERHEKNGTFKYTFYLSENKKESLNIILRGHPTKLSQQVVPLTIKEDDDAHGWGVIYNTPKHKPLFYSFGYPKNPEPPFITGVLAYHYSNSIFAQKEEGLKIKISNGRIKGVDGQEHTISCFLLVTRGRIDNHS